MPTKGKHIQYEVYQIHRYTMKLILYTLLYRYKCMHIHAPIYSNVPSNNPIHQPLAHRFGKTIHLPSLSIPLMPAACALPRCLITFNKTANLRHLTRRGSKDFLCCQSLGETRQTCKRNWRGVPTSFSSPAFFGVWPSDLVFQLRTCFQSFQNIAKLKCVAVH